jgi:RNA polymerase sigma-B factor
MARRLRGLAEIDDLQQEARLALVQAAARVQPGADPLHYIRCTVAGALRRYVRDRVRLVRVSRRAHEAGKYPLGHASLDAPMTEGGPAFVDLLEAPEPEEAAPRDALAAEVERMVETLPAADAAALRLLVMEGRSIREAAAVLGVSPMTASRRRDRAVDAIRYALGA